MYGRRGVTVANKVEWIEKGAAAGLKPAHVNKVLKASLIEMALNWYNRFFGQKFETGAQNRYHLQERSRKYINRVKKEYGHWKPFHKSGALESMMRQGVKAVPKVQGNKMEVTAKIRRPHATSKWVGLELIKVLKYELVSLLREFKDKTVAAITKGGK